MYKCGNTKCHCMRNEAVDTGKPMAAFLITMLIFLVIGLAI